MFNWIKNKAYLFDLPARAIVLALVIVLVASVLSGTMIGLQYVNELQQIRQFSRINANNNMESGIAVLSSGLGLTDFEDFTPYVLFENSLDTVFVKANQWGAYRFGSVRSFFLDGKNIDTLETVFLLGVEKKQNDPALYLQKSRYELTFVGKSQVRGNAVLPFGKAEKGTVNGLSSTVKQLVTGNISNSTVILPKDNKELYEFVCTKAREVKPSSKIQDFTESLKNAFSNQTVEMNGTALNISEDTICGNVIVRASQSIHVSRTAYLENVILVAPKIQIDAGFSGSIQAFASTELVLGEGVQLDYPSFLALSPLIDEQAKMEIGKKSKIEGGVLTLKGKTANTANVVVDIQTEAIVVGEVFAEGEIMLNGLVKGNVVCGAFKFNQFGKLQTNLLLDGIIDKKACPKAFLYPISSRTLNPVKILKWL